MENTMQLETADLNEGGVKNLDTLTNYDAKRRKAESKQRSNKKYRQTMNGWLRNYYSRLKSRKHRTAFILNSESFRYFSELSESFVTAWGRYVASGFDKRETPKLSDLQPINEGGEVSYKVLYA